MNDKVEAFVTIPLARNVAFEEIVSILYRIWGIDRQEEYLTDEEFDNIIGIYTDRMTAALDAYQETL